MYLNCHTYYSFKYGTMSPEQLLQQAQQNGITSLAITDINNTSGVLDFVRLAPKYKINPVAGIDFRNGTEQKFIGIAKNSEGFRELNDFLSYYLHNNDPIPDKAPVFKYSFIIYPRQAALKNGKKLRENEFIGVTPKDVLSLQVTELKNQLQKLVMLYPVTFSEPFDYNTHKLLRAIDLNLLGTKVPQSEYALPDETMLHQYELIKKYGDYHPIIDNTVKLLDACSIDFQFGKNKNKKTFTGNMYEDELLLLKLCNENLKYRYPNANAEIVERYEKEIKVITELGYASYFLTNWDIVRYARHRNFYYVGRGSGANSIVAYLLRITDVDPVDLDLYFERFINAYRTSPPDFDLDFSSDERDEIIDYIFKKHGSTRTAQLATYSTFQWNAVIRELGKVFGLPKEEIDSLGEDKKHPDTNDKIYNSIIRYGKRILDFPNHLSIHAGGILISELPMTYYTATVIPPKGFPLTQFSMLEAEDVGLYKYDILAQRGLGKMRDAVDIIAKNGKEKIDLHDVKRFKEDEKVRENLMKANLIGCFYVESPAMRMLLSKLEAKTYLDLVAASSIIRPGVASSGMMREYILRFKGRPATYATPKAIYDILKETFGVMVYQEDVIKVAHLFAGLTLGEADMLRRGMSGKYRGRHEFTLVEKKFFDGCRERGIADTIAKEVWRQIESFAGYAFSKGHSASYAVESYQCMFLKTYYPHEYMVAVINNGGGFYNVETYVHEARMCGATIHAPDINKSEYLTVIYGSDIYLGFHLLKEFETNSVEAIMRERQRNGEFASLEDFMKRVSISVEQLRILIRIGAFRFTRRSKKQLLWDIYSILGAGKKTEVRKELFEIPHREFSLPVLHHGSFDDAFDEIEIIGFPLRSRFELLKDGLPSQLCAADMKNHLGKIISIAGQRVVYKSTRTKHGDAMAFGTFLDKDGHWLDTTHFPDVLKKYPIWMQGCYLITGKVVEDFGFYSIDVTEIKYLESVTRQDVPQITDALNSLP